MIALRETTVVGIARIWRSGWKFLCYWGLNESEEKIYPETMIEPTPMSMRPTPNISALQNDRGNILKSTARMQMHVRDITKAR